MVAVAPNPRPRPRRRRWARTRRTVAVGGWALLAIGVLAVGVGAAFGAAAWTFFGLSTMLAGSVCLIVTGAPTWE